MDAAAVARPYAAAVFALAREGKTLDLWQKALWRFAESLKNMETAAAGRLLDATLRAEIVLRGADNDDLQKRFIALLAKNGRLEVLPHIAERFDLLRLEDAGIVRAKVESAVAIDNKKEFDRLLEKRFGKQVESTYEVVPELLGGVRVYMRDDVLDASLLGRKDKLKAALA